MIDTVLFDFVNTIAFLVPYKEDILMKFCEKNNIELTSRSNILKFYAETDSEMPYSSVNIRKKNEKKQFYSEYNKKLFGKLKIEGHEKFYDFYHSVKKQWELDDYALELFSFLRKKQIRIGILSNFDDNLEDILKNLNITDMIDFVVVSAKVGLEKPDVKFYNYAKNEYNINTDKTIYVGDSYDLDYVPSTKAGFKSFLIDRNNIIEQDAQKINNLNVLKRKINNVA